MRVDNLNDLVETRANIEFVSEILKLLAKEAQKGQKIEHLGFMLLQLQSILDKATTKIFDIESDEVDDDGSKKD